MAPFRSGPLALACCVGALACGGERGADAVATAAASADTTFFRKLGGAGNEFARGMAAAPDGSVVSVSSIGGSRFAPLELGLVRVDAAGRTVWARTVNARNADVSIQDVARSPLGNTFLAVRLLEGTIDFGGGPISGDTSALVKLGGNGAVQWQRAFPGEVATTVAVDGEGRALVGLVNLADFQSSRAVKLGFDGSVLWEVQLGATRSVAVAFDPQGNAVVANGHTVDKRRADGSLVWSVPLEAPVHELGTTRIGTVVASGTTGAPVAIGDHAVGPTPAGDPGAFLAVLEGVDGFVRWAEERRSGGPISVDPEGRIAMLDVGDGVLLPEFGCDDELALWNLNGQELWRRRVASCAGGSEDGAFSRDVAVAPSREIWVQGDANQPFGPGTGTVVSPQGSDWFLLRVAP